MRTPEERKKDSHSKYAHIFDGDFDYSRWDGKTHTWAEKRRERNKEYGRKRRSADFKRKHGQRCGTLASWEEAITYNEQVFAEF